MKTIYKYPLEFLDEQTYAMPKGANILSVKWVRGQICIYALIDTDENMCEVRKFLIIGTGHIIKPNTTPATHYFIGTVHNEDQSLVFHVFEKKEQ